MKSCCGHELTSKMMVMAYFQITIMAITNYNPLTTMLGDYYKSS